MNCFGEGRMHLLIMTLICLDVLMPPDSKLSNIM